MLYQRPDVARKMSAPGVAQPVEELRCWAL